MTPIAPLENEVSFTRRSFCVTLEYIEEGLLGTYDPKDPNDRPMLRMRISHRQDGDPQLLNNGSFCTRIDARVSRSAARRICRGVADMIAPAGTNGIGSIELLSWMDSEASVSKFRLAGGKRCGFSITGR